MMLPGMDGMQVCQALRAEAGDGRVPIIMLTARGEEADRVRGLELGADDYVDQAVQSEGAGRARGRAAAPRSNAPKPTPRRCCIRPARRSNLDRHEVRDRRATKSG